MSDDAQRTRPENIVDQTGEVAEDHLGGHLARYRRLTRTRLIEEHESAPVGEASYNRLDISMVEPRSTVDDNQRWASANPAYESRDARDVDHLIQLRAHGAFLSKVTSASSRSKGGA